MSNYAKRNRTMLNFLSTKDHQDIHSEALRVLETIGVKVESDKVLDLLKNAGAKVDHSKKMVKFLPSFIEQSIRQAPKKIIYGARNPKYDLVLELGGGTYSRSISGTAGYIDLTGREYRMASISDARHWAILVDALENIGYCTGLFPHDVPAEIQDIYLMPVLLENTEKHLEIQVSRLENIEYMMKMALAVVGSEDEFRKRPLFNVLASCRSPLQFSEYATDTMLTAGRYGVPIELLTMPSAGGSAPVTMAGTLMQAHAETLAGIAISQTVTPGGPVVCRVMPVILDMAKGFAMLGTVQNAMLSAANVQLVREYCGIPIHLFGPASDARICDGQSNIERVFNTLLPALAGANIVGGAGQLDNGTADPVQLVIDDDILGMTSIMLKGIEINDDRLGIDALNRVGPGGHFLADDHTLKYCRLEYFRPYSFNREPRSAWQENGSKDLNENARQRAIDIIKKHECVPLEKDVIKELRSVVRHVEAKLK